MNTTPFRLTRRNYQFYEPCIKAIVDNYPKECVFDPALSQRSPATFCARLRDAMLSLTANPDWDEVLSTRLVKIRETIVVKHLSNGQVSAGPPQVTELTQAVVSVTPPVPITQEPLTCYNIPVRDLCWLAHHHALAKPVKVQTNNTMVHEYENEFDVAFESLPDGTFILT